jgi:hypothetical protein
MTGRKYEKPLYLEMPFEEALGRYAQTDPVEIPDNKKLRKQDRPPKPRKCDRSRKPRSPVKP